MSDWDSALFLYEEVKDNIAKNRAVRYWWDNLSSDEKVRVYEYFKIRMV